MPERETEKRESHQSIRRGILDLKPKDTLILEEECGSGKFSDMTIKVDSVLFDKDGTTTAIWWVRHPHGEPISDFGKSIENRAIFPKDVGIGEKTQVVFVAFDETKRLDTVPYTREMTLKKIRYLGLKNYQRTPIGL